MLKSTIDKLGKVNTENKDKCVSLYRPTISPGSSTLKGILSHLSSPPEVCSRIAGFAAIHPSFPLKLI